MHNKLLYNKKFKKVNNNNIINGDMSALSAILLGIVTWFTPENVENSVKILAGIGSIITAILAIRYYTLAIKEKKLQIKEKQKK